MMERATKVIELDFVAEPDREQKSVKEKRETATLFIGNPNRAADYVAWQCTKIWLSPIWKAWKNKLNACNLDYRSFMRLASYTYPGEWLLGKMSWRDLLEKLVKILNEKCKGYLFRLKG
jgi:hypothetical protein